MRIICDADDTLYDTLQHCIEKYNAITGESLKIEQITDWDISNVLKYHDEMLTLFRSNHIYTTVPLKDGAVEMLMWLSAYHEVVIATSGHADVLNTKLNRYMSDFPFMNESEVAFCNNKGVYKADVLIDDRVEFHRQFKMTNPRGLSILIDMPHNRDCDIEHVRVSDLSKIDDIVYEYEKRLNARPRYGYCDKK